MANLEIIDGGGTQKYLKATGSGSAGDPHIPQHLDTNSAAMLAAIQAVQAAVEILDNVVSGAETQVDVLTMPADPFGTNADSASVAGGAGSVSAKLRLVTTQLAAIASSLGGTLAVSLPTGAATEARQATGNTALAAIQTAVEAVKTAVELLDNAVGGNELQVDVLTLPALGAGTANIGDVDVLTLPAIPAGTNNIGDVDIASIAAGDNNIGNVDIASAIPAGTNNIGDVDVLSVAIPATFYMGQKAVTTAGTELVLASSQALLSGVTVKALHGNTGFIYVGTNPVTSATGFVLDAGEQIFIEIDNLADVYVDCSVNGEGVSYIAS